MNDDSEQKIRDAEKNSTGGNRRKIWLLAALAAAVAAFVFQWKNSVDQAAISDANGITIRAKTETVSGAPAFRVFRSGNATDEISPPDIYDGDGNFICKTARANEPDARDGMLFTPVPADAEAASRLARERFPRLVFFSLKENGKPAVLVLKKFSEE